MKARNIHAGIKPTPARGRNTPSGYERKRLLHSGRCNRRLRPTIILVM